MVSSAFLESNATIAFRNFNGISNAVGSFNKISGHVYLALRLVKTWGYEYLQEQLSLLSGKFGFFSKLNAGEISTRLHAGLVRKFQFLNIPSIALLAATGPPAVEKASAILRAPSVRPIAS